MRKRDWTHASASRPCPICSRDRLCSWIYHHGTPRLFSCAGELDRASVLVDGVNYRATKLVESLAIGKPCRIYVAENWRGWVAGIARAAEAPQADDSSRKRLVDYVWGRAAKRLADPVAIGYLRARGVPISGLSDAALASIGFDAQSMDEQRTGRQEAV